MDDAEALIISAIGDMLDSIADAQSALARDAVEFQRGREFLQSGRGITEALQTFPVALRRETTHNALQRTNEARHELRLLAIAACVDEGMPLAQIAEIWGVSRQRVSQYVAEIKERGVAEHTD